MGEISIGEKALEAFSKLKQENSSYELKKINGRYYVYLSFGTRDRVLGKTKKTSLYKGKITEEGVFVEAKHRRTVVKTAAESTTAKSMELKASSAINLAEPADADATIKSGAHEKALLTALSMNGRISLPALSKITGLSVNATNWQVDRLEKRYGIRYVPEIDVTKFGYMQFFLALRFLDNKPPVEELKRLLQREPRIQMAMTLKGDYDLLIYAVARSIDELNNDIIIGISKAMGNYNCTWTTMPFHEDYGFIPIRDEFIDFLKDSLLFREYAILKELNRNGKCEFSEIDRKYGFDRGRTNYSYYKLRGEGKVRRITISMQKLPFRYNGIIQKTLVNRGQFERNRHKSLLNIIEEDVDTVTNKHAFVCDTVNPYGSMLFLPVFNNLELDRAFEELSSLELGMKFTTLIVTNLLIGDFCYRKFDKAHSVQHQILEREYGHPKAQRVDYEETGRKKAHAVRLDIRGARIPQADF